MFSFVFWQSAVQFGLLGVAGLALIVALVGTTGSTGTPRKKLAVRGLVVMLIALVLVAGSVPLFDNAPVRNSTLSRNDAQLIATDADLLSKPTSPTQALSVIKEAAESVETRTNDIIKVNEAYFYHFNITSSNGHGKNTFAVCVAYSHNDNVWIPSVSPC